MRSIVYFLMMLATLSLVSSCTRTGGHWQHYRISAVTEARDRGMTIFLHFHEDQNPTCAQQKQTLEELIRDERFKKVGAYRVAYDSEKALQKVFQVSTPCTLIVLRGRDEKGRAISESDPTLLQRMMLQGLE